MNVIGIICEYNPFHKGHIYHIDKIKEMYPDSLIIACISSSFTQRGEISILNKWDKTKIALDNNIDLVVELPTLFSTQSADIFAKAALKILNELKIEKLVFGSECNNIDTLKEVAKIQIDNKDFDNKVKEYIDMGNNYPTSLSLALNSFNINKIDNPNDLLGVSYIKEILKNKYNIEPISIKRTNNYHGNNKGNIISATEIRNLLKNNKSVKKYINYDEKILYKSTNYFELLKYEILNHEKDLITISEIDEGIERRIIKAIDNSNSLEELIKNIKTKRYTYNKIKRLLNHILLNIQKEDTKLNIDYIRILGFNNKGKNYLNRIKKDMNIKPITKYKDTTSKILEIEKKVTKIHSLIVNDNNQIIEEFTKPIYKE